MWWNEEKEEIETNVQLVKVNTRIEKVEYGNSKNKI